MLDWKVKFLKAFIKSSFFLNSSSAPKAVALLAFSNIKCAGTTTSLVKNLFNGISKTFVKNACCKYFTRAGIQFIPQIKVGDLGAF